MSHVSDKHHSLQFLNHQTSYSSLYEFYKGLEDYFRTNPDGTLSYSIGTNEYIEHDSIKSIIYCLDISFITVDQAEAIKQTIGLAYGEASLLDILDYV